MKVSAAIMAHEKRADMVPSILEALDAPAVVVWDDGSNSRWGTGRRALLAHNPSADYHLVIQDDAIVCCDLIAGLSLALDSVPEYHPVGLYVGRQRPMRSRVERAIKAADDSGDAWMVHDGPLWGVAVAVPVSHIDAMVGYGDRLGVKNYDLKMTRYFTAQGLKCWYTHPSLVDHRGDVDSLWAGPARGRVAHRFIGAQASALGIDWSKVPPGPRPLAASVAGRRRR